MIFPGLLLWISFGHAIFSGAELAIRKLTKMEGIWH
jgi:hypothetical protein